MSDDAGPRGEAGTDAAPPSPDELPAAGALLADLADEDYLILCRWWAWSRGWPESGPLLVCDGFAVGIQSPDECLAARITRAAYPMCDATVGHYYDCDASGYTPCDNTTTPPPGAENCYLSSECGDLALQL